MNDQDLLRYLDNELDEQTASKIADRLKEDPDLSRKWAELRAVEADYRTMVNQTLRSERREPTTSHDDMKEDEIGFVRAGRKRTAWLKVFLSGLVVFFASLVILILTGNPNLFPTVVLVGNALVPITFVAFLYERSELSWPSLLKWSLASSDFSSFGGVGGRPSARRSRS